MHVNVHGSCNHYKSSLLEVTDEINTYLLSIRSWGFVCSSKLLNNLDHHHPEDEQRSSQIKEEAFPKLFF